MVDLADAAVVAILTRAPSSGGKSRLFQSLGCPPDAALAAALLADTAEAVAAPGIRRVAFAEPPGACDEVRALIPDVDVLPQQGTTLGERMAAAFRIAFDRGARAVALVGSDLPDLPTQVVTEAFAALTRDPSSVVLGPAADGGYYLVGATMVPPLFDGIEWGTASVLEQTTALARRRGVRLHLLPVVSDVDTKDDLFRVKAPRTREWVNKLNSCSPTGK